MCGQGCFHVGVGISAGNQSIKKHSFVLSHSANPKVNTAREKNEDKRWVLHRAYNYGASTSRGIDVGRLSEEQSGIVPVGGSPHSSWGDRPLPVPGEPGVPGTLQLRGPVCVVSTGLF